MPWTFGPPIVTATIFWVVWAAIFRYYAKADDEAAFLRRATRWLLRGSMLELIIAVPSHVIVRRREDCCAPSAHSGGLPPAFP